MVKICKAWNKRGGCRCEYRAKGTSDFCGVHEPFVGDTCSICLEDVTSKNTSRKLKCGHMFHNICVYRWLNSGNENAHCCAMCRKPWRRPVEPVLPKILYLEHPPDWMWNAIIDGPERAPRDLLNEIDPDDPPPLVFEDFMLGGETLSISMTMDLWEQLVEPI